MPSLYWSVQHGQAPGRYFTDRAPGSEQDCLPKNHGSQQPPRHRWASADSGVRADPLHYDEELRNHHARGVRIDSRGGPVRERRVAVDVAPRRDIERRTGSPHKERAEHVSPRAGERTSRHKAVPDIGYRAAIFLREVELIRREATRTIDVREDPAVRIVAVQTQPAAEIPAYSGFLLINAGKRAIPARCIGKRRGDISGQEQVHRAGVL